MKRNDILTLAGMAVGLGIMAAIGVATNWFDAQKFRSRMQSFAQNFPDRIKMLREDLIAEEGIAPEKEITQ